MMQDEDDMCANQEYGHRPLERRLTLWTYFQPFARRGFNLDLECSSRPTSSCHGAAACFARPH